MLGKYLQEDPLKDSESCRSWKCAARALLRPQEGAPLTLIGIA